MTRYTATFAGNTIITRNTERTYSHAWIMYDYRGRVYAKGFSGDLAKAQTAAAASLPRDISERDKKNARIVSGHRTYAKQMGFANVQEWYASNTKDIAERRANLTTEVVAVTSDAQDQPMRFKMSHGPDGDVRMSRKA